jgi:hypothetical protein
MKERNSLNEQEEGMAYENSRNTAARSKTIEILSSAENTYLLHNNLRNILLDASGCCEYTGYVDHNGHMRVKIQCVVSDEEKLHSWDQLTRLLSVGIY